MAGSEVQIGIGTNPYVGPRPFETGERLFGREREITELYYLLSAERIVLLHSPSGAGKSSLIQAGLIPRLRERFDVWRPTRVNLPPPVGVKQDVNRFALSAALGFEQGIPEKLRRSPGRIAGTTLSEYARARPRRPSAPESVLLIFDQFEEILTIDPLAVDAKREFFDQLGELLHDPRYWAIFAMREDYLAPLDPYADQVPTHLKNRFRIDLLGIEEAREAIATPSLEAGREFREAAVDKLVRDLATMKVQQPDGTFVEQTGLHVEPLQLQVVCRGLWERIPPDSLSIGLEDVEQFGNVTEALSEYYAAEVAKIAAGDVAVERAIREWVGEKLITPDGIRGQVLRGAGMSEGLANDRIASLVDTHLVRAEQRAGAVWYELAHDRLIEPVRTNNAAWRDAHLNQVQKRASVWEAQSRPAGLLLLGAELDEAQHWAREQGGLTEVERRFLGASVEAQAAAEKEWRQARRIRRLAIASTIVGVVALIAGAVAWSKWRESGQNLEVAKKQENRANQSAEEAVVLAKQAKWEGWLADGQRILADKNAREASSERNIAEGQKTQAEQQTREARIALSKALANQSASVLANMPRLSLLLALEALDTTSRVKAQRVPAAEEAFRNALAVTGGRVLDGFPGEGTDVGMSPNNHWLVQAGSSSAVLWDLTASDTVVSPRALEGGGRPIAISPNGHWLVTGSGWNPDGLARLWDLTARDPTSTGFVLKLAIRSTIFAISPDSRWLVTLTGSNMGQLWDLTVKTPPAAPLDCEKGSMTALAISPNSHWLTIGTAGNTCLWDLAAAVPAAKPVLVPNGGRPIAVSPDSRWLVTDGDSKAGRLVDLTATNLPAAARTLTGHKNTITRAAFSTDSRWLVTGSNMKPGPVDTAVRVWDLKAADPAANSIVLEGDTPIGSIKISSDNHWLVLGGGGFIYDTDHAAHVWELPGNQAKAKHFVLDGQAHSVTIRAISPDNRWLVTDSARVQGGVARTIRLWDLTAQNPAINSTTLSDRVTAVDVSPDNRWLAIGSGSDTVLWDLSTPYPALQHRVLRGHEGSVGALAFGPDSRSLVTASPNETARLWSLGAEQSKASPVVLESAAPAVVSPDGRWLFTVGADYTGRLWTLSASYPVESVALPGSKGDFHSIAFSTDGRWLVTGATSGTATLRDLTSQGVPARFTMKGRPGDFDKIVLSRDSRWLAGMGSKGGATLWDLRVRDPSAAIRPLPGDPRVVAFSPDGYWLTAGGSDKTIRVFDLRGTEPLARPVLLSADRPIDAIDFSPDGRWLVTRGDRQVALWDLRAKLTGATPQILRGKTNAIAISPNGHWLATSSQFSVSGMPILWDMTAKDPSASFTVLGPNITGEVAAISSDSRWLIFDVFQRIPEFQDKLGAYKSTGLWDLTARDPAVTRIVLPGFEAPIALSPDGHRLATYNENKEKISLWDLADSGPGPPVVLPEFASTVTFTPDGHWMAASGRDTVDLWNLRLEELATPACRAAGRNLTLEEWGHYFFGQPYHKTCPDLPAPIMGGKEVEAAYATVGLVTLAESAIQAGDVKGASSAYLQATRGAVENGGFEANGEICLFGSFNALAQVVMPACERAVLLAPDKGESRAIRGLARGASGNRLGAIEDLAFAVTNWQEGQVFDRKQLEAWLAELRKGHNPFDAQALKKLKTLVQGR